MPLVPHARCGLLGKSTHACLERIVNCGGPSHAICLAARFTGSESISSITPFGVGWKTDECPPVSQKHDPNTRKTACPFGDAGKGCRAFPHSQFRVGCWKAVRFTFVAALLRIAAVYPRARARHGLSSQRNRDRMTEGKYRPTFTVYHDGAKPRHQNAKHRHSCANEGGQRHLCAASLSGHGFSNSAFQGRVALRADLFVSDELETV